MQTPYEPKPALHFDLASDPSLIALANAISFYQDRILGIDPLAGFPPDWREQNTPQQNAQWDFLDELGADLWAELESRNYSSEQLSDLIHVPHS